MSADRGKVDRGKVVSADRGSVRIEVSSVSR